MINVLEFADVINRHDFIDTIVQSADPEEFRVDVCVRTENHNIAAPKFPAGSRYRLLPGNTRRDAIQTAWKLSRLLKEWEIDILHAHHFEQAIVGWIATRVYRKTKLVIGRHYSDAIYRQSNRIKQKGLLAVERMINRAATRIIVPSEYILDILIKQDIGREKIDVILYGFDPEKYSAISSADVQRLRTDLALDGRLAFGNFSRLHEEKGHKYLIDALRIVVNRIPNALLLLVGEGAERESLERQVTEARLEAHVKFLGWRTDAMEIMSAVDVVVQSTLQEAFSQVMCEALWMGKPLVITEVSGVRDILTDGNAIVVPKADCSALADAMIRIGISSEERDRLGKGGREFIREELTIGKIIGKYEASFRKAMSP